MQILLTSLDNLEDEHASTASQGTESSISRHTSPFFGSVESAYESPISQITVIDEIIISDKQDICFGMVCLGYPAAVGDLSN